MDTPGTKVDSRGRVWTRGGQPEKWEPGCIGAGGPRVCMDLPGFDFYFLMRCGVDIDEKGVYWWHFPPL